MYLVVIKPATKYARLCLHYKYILLVTYFLARRFLNPAQLNKPCGMSIMCPKYVHAYNVPEQSHTILDILQKITVLILLEMLSSF